MANGVPGASGKAVHEAPDGKATQDSLAIEPAGQRPPVNAPPPNHGLRRELLRKRIHLATLLVPGAVWFLPRGAAIAMLASAVLVALAVEWSRRSLPWARYQFLRRTRVMLRGHERHELAGATHMAIAYFLALLFFPKLIAILAMVYNGLGDTAAAVIGRRWGRHRTRWGKSWEGAAAGFGVNLAAGMAMPEILLIGALVGAVASAALEFLPLPLDDNLRITIGGGLAVWAAMWLGG